MKRVILVLNIIGILIFNNQISYGGSVRDTEVLSEKSAIYGEIMYVAIKWKDAVLMKDIEALVSYAAPEAQRGVKAEIENKSSELYRLFYDSQWNQEKGGHSVYDILKNAKKLRIVIQRDKDLEKFGGGVTVIYYDENRIKLRLPLLLDDPNDKEVQLLFDKGDIWSMYFFKRGEKWYTSYDFFEGDG
jgi:hypothetical protein